MKSTARLITEYRRAAIALGKRKLEVERKIANIGRLERELDSIIYVSAMSAENIKADADKIAEAARNFRSLDYRPTDEDRRADSNIA